MRTVAGWCVIVLALAGVLGIVLLPITRSWAGRVEAKTSIREDRWEIEREEFALRRRELSNATIAAGRAALWTLAIGVPAVALIGGILWFRVATQRQVVQRLPNDVPVLISRRIYDPRSALNAALDAPHPANLDHAMALAVQRPRYVPVDLIPRNPVLEVDYGE